MNLLFGNPYNQNWAISEEQSLQGEDTIIVSNACGYAIAGFRNASPNRYDESLFFVGETIGEWCRNPFADVSSHREYVIIPSKKNINREWQEGSYKSIVLEVYDMDSGYFSDPWDMRHLFKYKKNGKVDWKALDKKFAELNLPIYSEDAIFPIVMRELEDGEVIELDEFEAQLYTIQDRQILLKKVLRVDKLYQN